MFIRYILMAVLALPAIAVAADTDAQIAAKRAALLTAVLDPSSIKEKPVDIRCPIFGAETDGFSCIVVNSKGEDVGRQFLISRKLPVYHKKELVERCASPSSVAENCVANVTITADEHGTLFAESLSWVY